jgi:cytochrome bd ubiquinol oxidase subunit I
MKIMAAHAPLADHTVATTLLLFGLVYGIVFALGLCYINRLIVRGANEPLPETHAEAAAWPTEEKDPGAAPSRLGRKRTI